MQILDKLFLSFMLFSLIFKSNFYCAQDEFIPLEIRIRYKILSKLSCTARNTLFVKRNLRHTKLGLSRFSLAKLSSILHKNKKGEVSLICFSWYMNQNPLFGSYKDTVFTSGFNSYHNAFYYWTKCLII